MKRERLGLEDNVRQLRGWVPKGSDLSNLLSWVATISHISGAGVAHDLGSFPSGKEEPEPEHGAANSVRGKDEISLHVREQDPKHIKIMPWDSGKDTGSRDLLEIQQACFHMNTLHLSAHAFDAGRGSFQRREQRWQATLCEQKR